MKIPSGWIHLPPIGEVVEGTQFLPMKVPLDVSYDKSIKKKTQRFELLSMLADVKSKYNVNVIAVVDLTNTDRYYQREQLQKEGIIHIKIAMAGHSVIPPRGDVDAFLSEVNKLQQQHSSGLIIVHCTHGHNRTGYMICNYLCKVQGMSPERAINLFHKSRSPGIYKAAYIDALHFIYGNEDMKKGINITYKYPSERADDDEGRSTAVVKADGTISHEAIANIIIAIDKSMKKKTPNRLEVLRPEVLQPTTVNTFDSYFSKVICCTQ